MGVRAPRGFITPKAGASAGEKPPPTHSTGSVSQGVPGKAVRPVSGKALRIDSASCKAAFPIRWDSASMLSAGI